MAYSVAPNFSGYVASADLPAQSAVTNREWEVSGDKSTMCAKPYTPSAGDVWHAPRVHDAAPATHRHMVRSAERVADLAAVKATAAERISDRILSGRIF